MTLSCKTDGPTIHLGAESPERVEDFSAAPRPPKLAYVLSGGGSLGSVQVGAMEALLEAGLTPDLIVGTSIGALNGAWLARQPDVDGIQRLKELWASLKAHPVFHGGRQKAFLRMLVGRDYLYTNMELRKFLSEHMGKLTFEDMSISLFVTAANMDTGELRVFHEGSLVPTLLASTAIPGVFPFVTIDGYAYADGAILSTCSIETAWEHGATHIIVIECPHPPPGQAYGILGPMTRAFWLSLGRLCQLEVERFQGRAPTILLWPNVGPTTYDRKDLTQTAEYIEQARIWTHRFLETEGRPFIRALQQAQVVSRSSMLNGTIRSSPQ